MNKRLLIVEESLRDRKAHWFSYIRTIARAAINHGMFVDVACNEKADAEIIQSFNSFPVFKRSVYLDQHRRKLPGERFYSFILHSFRTLRILWPLLKKEKKYDEVFVPTVLVQHLLAWWFIMKFHSNRPARVTLFFVATPGVWNYQTESTIMPRSAKLMKLLLRLFAKDVHANRVRLGVETKTAKKEYEALTQLPFTLFPHPVDFNSPPISVAGKRQLMFCCYGFARHEKGSDILATAINEIITHNLLPPVSFRIQWLDAFQMPDGSMCGPDQLVNNDRVDLISRALDEKEYLELLRDTDCMLLPYRNSSYYARLSRVAIEAAFMGIPMVYTKGGWLEEIATEHGAGVGMKDGSATELRSAIDTIAANIIGLKEKAASNVTIARDYYSGRRFIEQLLK